MANQSICSIPNCGNLSDVKGFCNSHYWRLRRHGDPLGGRAPNGDHIGFILDVALKHQGDGCLSWPFAVGGNGRGQMRVDGKKVLAHRYICTIVNGAPPTPGHEAAHSCGKGHEGCIAPGHLSWKTRKENDADKLLHGTHNRGEQHPLAKIADDQVREIRSLSGKMTQTEIGRKFGISPNHVSKIQRRLKWAHIS